RIRLRDPRLRRSSEAAAQGCRGQTQSGNRAGEETLDAEAVGRLASESAGLLTPPATAESGTALPGSEPAQRSRERRRATALPAAAGAGRAVAHASGQAREASCGVVTRNVQC